MVQKLTNLIGKPDKTYFAVFRSEPDEEKQYLLERYNIKYFISDLKDFSTKLSKEVTLRDPKDLRYKRILIGGEILPVDSKDIGDFLTSYDPVLFEDYHEEVSPSSFFKGYLNSFKPFAMKWHFPRNQTNELVKLIRRKHAIKNKSNIILVEGDPGCGRSMIILAAVYELITSHRSIAIKISGRSFKKIPTIEELINFTKEIKKAAEKAKIPEPERILLYSLSSLDEADILKFRTLEKNYKYYPIFLVSEDTAGFQAYGQKIEVAVNLSPEEKRKLAEYIANLIKIHKFPEIDQTEISSIINSEVTFLPIIYRSLDPARRSINNIVNEELQNIDSEEARDLVGFCSIATAMDIDIPVAVLRKAINQLLNQKYDYSDVFKIVDNKASSFLKFAMDARLNPMYAVYHSLIANYITGLLDESKIASYLQSIAESVDIRSRVEAEFMSALFITHGVNWVPRQNLNRPFNDDSLIDAFITLKKRQPARPILHHLARLLFKMDNKDKEVIPILEEGLAEPSEKYALEERRENILTTMANLKWEQNKTEFEVKSIDNPITQDIFTLLNTAKLSNPNLPHPYDVRARIIRDIWQNKTGDERTELITMAIETINDGLTACPGDVDAQVRLNSRLIETLSEIDENAARKRATELLNSGDGTGCYTLALIQLHKLQDTDGALKLLAMATNAEKCPVAAFALQLEIQINSNYPDYDKMMKLSKKISEATSFVDDWKSALNKAIVCSINGRYNEGLTYFAKAHKKIPRVIQRKVLHFWMKDGRRKTFRGKIGTGTTKKEGFIYAHKIEGWKGDIYFNPWHQNKRHKLATGILVNFELGFSSRGPIAFDVRPVN